MASSIDELEFQTAFGRILSEPELNERFVEDPSGVGAELGLDAGQVAALESAGLSKLKAFSHNLSSKRVGLLKKVCPATYELIHQRKRLGQLAGQFVRRHPPRESKEYPNRTIRDGFWFVDYLTELQSKGELEDDLIGEVARFERSMLAVSSLDEALQSAEAFSKQAEENMELTREQMLARRPRRGGHTRIESFDVDMIEVIRSLGESQKIEQPSPRKTIVLFSKMPGWRNVRYANINERTRDLLEACDGFSTCREIIAQQLKGSLIDRDPNSFAESCLGLLTRLAQMNAVTFAEEF